MSFPQPKCFRTFAVWKHFSIYPSQSRGRTCPTRNSSFSSANLPPTSLWRKSKRCACANGQTSSCVADPWKPTSKACRSPASSHTANILSAWDFLANSDRYSRFYQRIFAIEFSILRTDEYPIPSIIDIVNSIRLAKGNVFAEWKQSDTAKLFADHGYKNKKQAGGYFF